MEQITEQNFIFQSLVSLVEVILALAVFSMLLVATLKCRFPNSLEDVLALSETDLSSNDLVLALLIPAVGILLLWVIMDSAVGIIN